MPPEMLMAQMGGLVTAVTELQDGRLVMMMDVEKILSETDAITTITNLFANIKPVERQSAPSSSPTTRPSPANRSNARWTP